jgi:hypothetical protein
MYVTSQVQCQKVGAPSNICDVPIEANKGALFSEKRMYKITALRALQPIHSSVIINKQFYYFIRVYKGVDKHWATSSFGLLEFSRQHRKNAEFAVP